VADISGASLTPGAPGLALFETWDSAAIWILGPAGGRHLQRV